MPAAAVAAVATVAAGAYSANKQSKATRQAADIQSQAALAGVDAQERQFEAVQKLLAPFVKAGTGALSAQQNLIGLNGAQPQQQAISAIEQSPQMQALVQQGENAILANASATGGLRGGNVQSTLAQFRPQILAQLIEEQFARLGGITSIGQNAAAGVGNAGMTTGSNVASLLQQQGRALAGGALGQGVAASSLANSIPQALGVYKGLGGTFPTFGGSTPPPAAMPTYSGTPSINNFG